MDKDKNKGLADMQEGEFMLNESGTTISIDPESEFVQDDDVVVGETDKRIAEETADTKDE